MVQHYPQNQQRIAQIEDNHAYTDSKATRINFGLAVHAVPAGVKESIPRPNVAGR